MASPLVQKFRNDTAPRLLAKFGNGGVQTVVRVVVQPTDPTLPPSSSATYSDVNAYVRGVSSTIITADANLVATDLQVIVAAIDYVPAVGGSVSINGYDRRVLRVDAIPAAGDPAIYKFYVR